MLPCTDETIEGALLGYVMAHPSSLARVGSLACDDFTRPDHAKIYECIGQLASSGKKPSQFAVAQQLKKRGYTSALSVLGALPQRVPSVAEAAEQLRVLSALRRARETALSVAAAAERSDLDEVRELSLKLIAEPSTRDGIQVEPIHKSVEAAWERFRDNDKFSHQKMGVDVFDKAVGPLPGGSLTTIGGYTGAGKSSLSLLFAIKASANRRVGIISCEDPREVWGSRILGHKAGFDVSRVFRQRDLVTKDEWARLASATQDSMETNIRMAYAVGRGPLDVTMAMRRLVRDEGCKLIFVDYLQAIRVRLDGVRVDKAYSDAVKQLKAVAAELDVPLVLCSQLKRPPVTASSGQPEPKVTDLKETGDLENESEAILLCWRPQMAADAPTMVRLAKLKWAQYGSLWAAERNERTGMMDVLREADPSDLSTSTTSARGRAY